GLDAAGRRRARDVRLLRGEPGACGIAARLEHFPLVLSTRPWYFSRSGGADGRGLFDGPADTRAEGFGRGSRVQGACRAVSRQSRLGGCTETAATRNRSIRAVQADEISRACIDRD